MHPEKWGGDFDKVSKTIGNSQRHAQSQTQKRMNNIQIKKCKYQMKMQVTQSHVNHPDKLNTNSVPKCVSQPIFLSTVVHHTPENYRVPFFFLFHCSCTNSYYWNSDIQITNNQVLEGKLQIIVICHSPSKWQPNFPI